MSELEKYFMALLCIVAFFVAVLLSSLALRGAVAVWS